MIGDRDISEWANDLCSCGGGGPDNGCSACGLYHAADKARREVERQREQFADAEHDAYAIRRLQQDLGLAREQNDMLRAKLDQHFEELRAIADHALECHFCGDCDWLDTAVSKYESGR